MACAGFRRCLDYGGSNSALPQSLSAQTFRLYRPRPINARRTVIGDLLVVTQHSSSRLTRTPPCESRDSLGVLQGCPHAHRGCCESSSTKFHAKTHIRPHNSTAAYSHCK
ncbi:hypothetical protein IG631_01457 [Alternaria alternata]|nr:hypothetical protein IG631_01457 [Alternaria alternata]